MTYAFRKICNTFAISCVSMISCFLVVWMFFSKSTYFRCWQSGTYQVELDEGGSLFFLSLCLCILFFLSALARWLSHIWIWCSLVEYFKGTEFMWFPNLIALIVFPHPSIGGVDREVFKATIWLMYLFCLEGKTSPHSLWWVVTVKIARLQIYYRTFWASVLICGAISFPRLTSRLTDLSFSIHTKHLRLSQV